jgi:DNA-binding transcriptional MerR regulator
MSEELYTIGRLARRTGVPVRTIRFWSDIGVLTPTGRSGGGYRLYDTEAVARLDLVRTLRELGLGLDVVQQIIDDFVDGVVDGMDPDAPATGIARNMREMPTELPDDPTPEQVDAWVELAELVGDEGFRRRVREMAVAGGGVDQLEFGPDHHFVTEHAGQARKDGIAPGSAEGKAVLDRIAAPDIPAAQRARMLEQLETFTDARVERYWQLMGIINGRPPFPSAVPSFEWLIEALRAHG